MERVNANGNLDVLRRANSRLNRFFERFSGAVVLGTEEEVGALLQVENALQSVGALLKQDVRQGESGEIGEEMERYRRNLVQLRLELACMQQSAEASRHRLDSRQKHLHAARAWCAASRPFS